MSSPFTSSTWASAASSPTLRSGARSSGCSGCTRSGARTSRGATPRSSACIVKPALPKGVYLWGAVGRGKSFLMDSFYLCVPLVRKRRVHFHHFMREIHREMNELKGAEDPIAEVAARTARRYRLICFDEFHVSDIADAMILGRFLEQVDGARRGVLHDEQLPSRPALPQRPAARALPAGDRAASRRGWTCSRSTAAPTTGA